MSDPLSEGVRLFDAGEFFAAHEAFEEAWRSASGDRKIALQSLTQLAAAFHKLREHGLAARGAAYLLERAAEKLDRHAALLGPLGGRASGACRGALESLAAGRLPSAKLSA